MNEEIELPSGKVITVPEGGTDEQVMNYAIEQGLAVEADFITPQEGGANGGMGNSGDVGGNNLAPVVAEPSLGREMLSGLELAGTLGAASVMEPLGAAVGGVAGGIASLLPFTEKGVGARTVEKVRDVTRDMTYQPRMPETQRAMKGMGDAASDAGEFITENVTKPLGVDDLSGRTLDATESPALATLVDIVPEAIATMLPGRGAISSVVRGTTDKAINSRRYAREANKLIASEVSKGNPRIDLVTKALDESGNLTTSKASVSAKKILGRALSKQRVDELVAVAENMSTASKKRFNKMLDDVERGNNEPIFKDEGGPSNRVGEAIADRANDIERVNTKASKDIGKITKSLENKVVDISAPIKEFSNKLKDFGVTFSKGEDGWVTPDFSRSKFKGGDAKEITVLINDLMNTKPGFLAAHNLKREIRDNLDMEANDPRRIKGSSEKALKDLSKGIDDVLDINSAAYRRANEVFADTIELKNDWQKLAGKGVDFDTDVSSQVLGLKTKRMVSNAVTGPVIRDLINKTDQALSKQKIYYKDDVPQLAHMATHLEDLFKLTKSDSLRGNLERSRNGSVGMAGAVDPSMIAGMAVDEGVSRISKMRSPDFKKKMQILRALNNQKAK